MKKFILALIVILSVQLNAFSQTDYPRYEKDSAGQTIVLLTLEQAQALDNSTDLLLLFEKLNSQIINYDSVCVKVIGEKDKVISQQTIQINKLKEVIANKDQQIANLQLTVAKKDETIENLDKQVKNGEDQISLGKKEIKRLKGKMAIGGSLGGIAIVGLILAIIM
jgi:hypothetical protein